jgi:sedoheptulose-bisphosphatase
LRHSPIIKLESTNQFGDEQLHQDVHCDAVIEKHLERNHLVKGFASEERPFFNGFKLKGGKKSVDIEKEEVLEKQQVFTYNDFEIREDAKYFVTYDPLDGSSIVDTNFAIGSIFSIWNANRSFTEPNFKLRDQANAVITIFGPRTTAVFYNAAAEKVQEVTLIDDHWIISHDHCIIKEKTNIFSPGNLRSASDNVEYREAVVEWVKKGFTLRYTGGLVVDVYQIFIKGHGIFSNCGSQKHKCKLRALYEAAALGYLIEKAGGKTITAGGGSLLDYVSQNYDDRL